MKKQVFALVFLAVQGCVTPAICTKDGAFDAGRQSAMAGRALDFGDGSSCEAETAAVFRTEYQKGYDTGLQVLCSVQNASDDGRDAGLQGQTVAALPVRYNICAAGDKGKLEKAFLASYRNAIAQYCSVDAAQSRGTQAGRANQGLESDATWLGCPAGERPRLKQAFQSAYLNGLRDYCDPNNHIETIRGLAKTSNQASYDPRTYGSCAQQFPQLLNAYYDRFYQERQTVVNQLCTYENGRAEGRADAEQMDRPRGSTPDFCDERFAREYQRGYRRGFEEQKQVVRDVRPGPNPTYPGNAAVPSSDAVIQACGEAFSFNSDKLECIQASKTVRNDPAALIRACKQVYSMNSDRLQCLRTSRSYYAVQTLQSCKQATSFSSDLQACVDRLKDVRFDPTRDVEACKQTFSMGSDRMECVGIVGQSRSPAAERIYSCKKAFNFGSDVMKCIKS